MRVNVHAQVLGCRIRYVCTGAGTDGNGKYFQIVCFEADKWYASNKSQEAMDIMRICELGNYLIP